MAYSTERLIDNAPVYSGKGTLKDMRKLAIQIMKREGYLRIGIVDLNKPRSPSQSKCSFKTVGEVELENGKYFYADYTVKDPHVRTYHLGIDGSLKGIFFEHKGYEITEDGKTYTHNGRMEEKKYIDYLKATAFIRKTKHLKIKNLTDNRIVYEGEFKNGKWYKKRK